MSTEKSVLQRAFEWHEQRLPIGGFIDSVIGTKYPAPKNLNYWWNFGSLNGLMLVIMIASGIFLAMNYTPHKDFAFDWSSASCVT